MKESDYSRLTYDLATNFAQTALKCNKEITFCYVSGAGTDSSEKGKTMWAGVKGRTENSILTMGFEDAYAFRPGYIKPNKDTPTQTAHYKILLIIGRYLHPLIKSLIPQYTTTMPAIAKAMIHVSFNHPDKKILESNDINCFGSTPTDS